MNFARLETFIQKCRENVSQQSDYGNGAFTQTKKEIIDFGIKMLKQRIKHHKKILDIGCGDLYAIRKFNEMGFNTTGITVCVNDFMSSDYDIREVDMNFMDFEEGSFDVVWARHSLEHSFMPLFTLTEIRRVLNDNGLIYMEVPGPSDRGFQENNKEHFSVHTPHMWYFLLKKAGFKNIEVTKLNINKEDKYYSFIAEVSCQ